MKPKSKKPKTKKATPRKSTRKPKKVSPSSHLKVIGLTGGIASGKSAVAEIFMNLGVPVIDADQISRTLAQPGGAAHNKILKRFKTTDRKKLRELVFRDEKARRDLEAILHPLIQSESKRQMEALAQQSTVLPGVVLYEAALLVETGRHKDLDGLIVVETPREIRLKRLVDRDARKGMTSEMAKKIMDAQASDEERRHAATFVIDNSGIFQELKTRVAALIQSLKNAN
ncbi:dephospho-CoA kinase [bacterium]|nr:dephospho-CoA kinase [bacterium]